MDLKSEITLRSGSSMPVMGLGTWQLTRDTSGTVEAALDLGYRLIDTSGDYGTQPGIGKGIERSGVRREDLFIETKIEETDDAYEAARKNLDELHLDYVDLMLIHRPPASGAGEELWRGLIRARDEGLTRDIGVSNYPAGLIEKLIDATSEVPVVNQIEWTPLGHSAQMKRYAHARGLVIQAYSPLTRATRLDDTVLEKMAARYGKSPAQILIRWNLQRGTVPLPKANRSGHLREDIDVFDFEIDDQDLEALDHCNERYSALGDLPYT